MSFPPHAHRRPWFYFCLLVALTLWVVQVVSTCRDRGLVPRMTLTILALKTALIVLKSFRQLIAT